MRKRHFPARGSPAGTRQEDVRKLRLWARWSVLISGVILSFLCASVSAAVAPGSEPRALPGPFEPATCFDKVWNAVRAQFWDPNFNGVHWEQAGQRYRPRALAAGDYEGFAVVVNEMPAELRTSHTCYLTKWDQDYYGLQAAVICQSLAALFLSDPSELEKLNPGQYSSEGRPRRVGIGVVTKWIKGYHYVEWVVDKSPARKAGVLLGDRLLDVDGRPFHPIRSFEGKAGRTVELAVQRGPEDSSKRIVKLTPVDREERELFEEDSLFQTRVIEHEGRRFAYLPLYWLSGWRMRDVLDKGVDLACESEGLIIDQFNHQVIEIDSDSNVVFTQGSIGAAGNGSNQLNGPCDAKVIGDYTGLTSPSLDSYAEWGEDPEPPPERDHHDRDRDQDWRR